ncbi:hypothetical protein HWV07_11060 [Natronomonas salina]|uniref:DUF7344 domain-containing protein n=1 Tax=Natronomonas salina TaxID=1710540 RepID=UPI0015B5BA56|nr:hypothetical protein [Natronomonas salina]QLD89541.1 hypothetical protein HWV07_11060 [Natronomonas salina]
MASFALVDDILRALADHDRRLALYYLQAEDEAEIEMLARQVVAWSEEKPIDEITDDELQQLIMEFRHNHLNRLRDAGCIEYDERTGMVRYMDPPTILEGLLGVLAPLEHPEEN